MSTTPSRTWSISCGGVPPSCIAGNTWHFILLFESAAILSQNGCRIFVGGIACGGQKWCTFKVMSCAAAPSDAAASARESKVFFIVCLRRYGVDCQAAHSRPEAAETRTLFLPLPLVGEGRGEGAARANHWRRPARRCALTPTLTRK